MTMHVYLYYPNIDIKDRKEDQPTEVSIGLEHVRAADSIIVDYDFTRDGYRIRMEEVVFVDGGADGTGELKEVAFIPAWLEKKE